MTLAAERFRVVSGRKGFQPSDPEAAAVEEASEDGHAMHLDDVDDIHEMEAIASAHDDVRARLQAVMRRRDRLSARREELRRKRAEEDLALDAEERRLAQQERDMMTAWVRYDDQWDALRPRMEARIPRHLEGHRVISKACEKRQRAPQHSYNAEQMNIFQGQQ